MRTAGGQQLSQLSTEAAWALKHSLSLARRRGHSQVTPLHVAATLIGSTLLKTACFKTQNPNPNPFQSRALELCFNVALNRLPTTPTPLQPSLSNALVAALKRAQAHQRRGSCVEQQQAPLLAVKVEVEQLILSILDDPSVSRVMREAGFSSTEVKNNIEENFSSLSSSSVFNLSNGGVYSTPPSPPDHRVPNNCFNFWQNPFWKQKMGRQACFGSRNSEDDIKLILEVLLKKKRKSNIVIVGDSVSSTEGLVLEIMDRIEKGDALVPEELKTTHFIKFQFSSMPLRYMKKEEVEMNMLELKRKVDCFVAGGKRVIVYTGDLNWTLGDDRQSGFQYNPVEHLVCDIGKLISEYNSGDLININGRVWLMGTANYQTYRKCQMKQPSLENQWCLQAVSVPSGGLALSLHATSGQDSLSQKPSQMVVDTKPFCAKEENYKLTCCDECTSKYEKEAAILINKDLDKTSTQLPFWLKPQITDMQKDDLVELRSKWNRLCHIQQHQSNSNHNNAYFPMVINRNLSNDRTSTYPSSNPSWSSPNNLLESNSISFIHSNSKPIYTSSYPRFRRQQSCHIDFSSNDGDQNHQVSEPNLDSLKNTEGKDVKITLALGSSLLPDDGKLVKKQNEVLEKLKENVPWHVETVPLVVAALVQESKLGKNESWLLIEGNDVVGKRRLALGLALSMFGSTDFLLHVNMKEGEYKRDLFCETLGSALQDSENLVVLVENVNFADAQFLKFLSDAFEGGKSGATRMKSLKSGQIIFILTKNDSGSYGDGKDSSSIIQMKLEVREIISSSGNKRKAEWDLTCKVKNPRTTGKQNSSSSENTEPKQLSSRQSSSNTLDLNLKAEDEDEDEENEYESEISKNSTKFLDMVKNRFIFNRDSTQDGVTKDIISCKITKSFEEVCKREGHFGSVFGVDHKLLEDFSICAGYFLDNQFEKWLQQVFKTSLEKVNLGVKGGETSVWLCLDTKEVTGMESSGYMGSCLPKKIHVSFMG